jgi:hypothetical protein
VITSTAFVIGLALVIVLGLDPNPSTSQGGPHRRHT